MLPSAVIRFVFRSTPVHPAIRSIHVSQKHLDVCRVIVKEPFYCTALRNIKRYFRRVKMDIPPYNHVTQVGDPILRGKSDPVEPNEIKTEQFQDLIKKMVGVMRKTGGVGLAGPQIGVAQQVFVMEFTEKHFRSFPEEIREAREMAIVPLKVFVNPLLKIVSTGEVLLPEGCLSLTGFTAATPRAHEVEITGLDENAELVSWRVSGYPARILQHEYDHLHGTLYIDRMDTRTFTDLHWPKWNEK